MRLSHYSVEELQDLALGGEEAALTELGRRVVRMRIHDGYHDNITCTYRWELESLQQALEVEIPLDCPHCGRWLTDV